MSEWEVVNEEGFVYKRKKRSRIIRDGEADSKAEAEAAAVQVKEMMKKKRRITFVKLKDKYKHEIHVWEHLSNTLISMQQHQHQHQHQQHPSDSDSDVLGFHSLPSQSAFFLSHLILQVEAQEAIIRDLSQLCEVAESLCSSVHEEKAKQQFIDLPIWRSPRELTTSLCED